MFTQANSRSGFPSLNDLSVGKTGDVQKILQNICKRKIPKYLDTELNESDRPIRKMDFDHTPTIDEMCVKYGEPFIAVLRYNKEKKLIHNEAKKGYSLGRNPAKMRYTAEIPVQIHGNPRNPLYWQYFHPQCVDKEERRKLLYSFLRKYDMAFSPIEKL